MTVLSQRKRDLCRRHSLKDVLIVQPPLRPNFSTTTTPALCRSFYIQEVGVLANVFKRHI